MKKNVFLALLVLFSALAAGLWIGYASTQTPSFVRECRTIVDGTRALQDLKFQDHLTESEPYRKDGDFDPNQYFKVFTHLSMAPGYTLDFVYYGDHLGGMPLLYARKVDSPQFYSYNEFLESYEEEITDEKSYGSLNHAYDYLQKVQVDGTHESYFEHLTLAFFGNMFYLSWHSLYNDTILLCEKDDLQIVEQDLDRMFDKSLPEDVKRKAEKIDFTPTIQISENSVTIRVILFTKWGGFYESTYQLDRNDPSIILDDVHRLLIEYDCGVRF